MSDLLGKLGVDLAKTTDLGFDLLEKLVATARPTAVFSPPVSTGDYAVITASEVMCGMGTGFGSGGDPNSNDATAPIGDAEGLKSQSNMTPSAGFGSGGGGGGFSTARPVAAISIGPDGVHVEPVVDATKIVLAFFTTLGAMALMFSKMRRHSK